MQKPSCQGDRVTEAQSPSRLSPARNERAATCEPANLAIWVQCAGVRGAHAHGARMDATFVPLSQILQLGNVTKRSYACMHALVHMIERSLGCMGWRRRCCVPVSSSPPSLGLGVKPITHVGLLLIIISTCDFFKKQKSKI